MQLRDHDSRHDAADSSNKPPTQERTPYSVRPRERSVWERLFGTNRRGLPKNSTSRPPDEAQFSLAVLFGIITLVAIALGGILLSRAYPVAYLVSACACVLLLAVVPPAWRRFGAKVVVAIGGLLIVLVVGALMLSFALATAQTSG